MKHHHRVNSGLKEFAPIPLRKPNVQKPSSLRFFTYFLIVLVVVTGVVLIVNLNLQSKRRIAENQAEIDKYTELLKPLPPKPSPSPTPERKPIVITRKPKATSAPPDYSSSDYYGSGYSTDSYGSGYSTGSPAGSSGGSKSVSVRGYYRKNGTYVSPHTRSRPRR